MKLAPLLVGIALVSTTVLAAPPMSIAPAPAMGPAAALGLTMAHDLVHADSWAMRFLALEPVVGSVPAVAAFEETRPVAALVGAVYADLGVELSLQDAGRVQAQADALPPRVAWALQQLLGAVQRGMADWRVATAAWTWEDGRVLQDPEADPEALFAVAAKADAGVLRGSALRMLMTVDAVQSVLRREAPTETEAALFPGPNEGLLFNDPLNLILVGGPGRSVYRGHTAPPAIHPGDHVLILDVGGDDAYYNRPATAHPGLCSLGNCGSAPVSVVLDVAGDDVYAPQIAGGSTGHGVWGGLGLLVDARGQDRYVGYTGADQGFGDTAGFGLLFDGAGNDMYWASSDSQASAQGQGVAVLLDISGDDTYRAGGGVQAHATQLATAVLADLDGDDAFTAAGRAQGQAYSGQAIFLNVGGEDIYDAGVPSRGWTSLCWAPNSTLNCPLGLPDVLGVFLDACGTDTYAGAAPGQDGTQWQQAPFGVGLDSNDVPFCVVAGYA